MESPGETTGFAIRANYARPLRMHYLKNQCIPDGVLVITQLMRDL